MLKSLDVVERANSLLQELERASDGKVKLAFITWTLMDFDEEILRLKNLAADLHKGSCKGHIEFVAEFRKLEAEVKVLRGIQQPPTK